jgi:hypothetical protein
LLLRLPLLLDLDDDGFVMVVLGRFMIAMVLCSGSNRGRSDEMEWNDMVG